MIEFDKIQDLVTNTHELPTLPVIVSQILKSLNDPHSAVKDIVEIVNKDQSITTKILKLVNSAYYGFPRRITTMSHAISILGFDAVKGLILGISVVDIFKIKDFNLTDFWKHSIATATLAKYIAKSINYPRVDEAFIVGLIHDIGKLFLMLKLPEEYKLVIDLIKTKFISSIEAESNILKIINHAKTGKMLAEYWNLPQIYVDSISHHHYPEFSKIDPDLTTILGLSNIFANDYYNKPLIDPETGDINDREKSIQYSLVLYEQRKKLFQYLGLSITESPHVLEYLDKKDEEIKEFLQLLNS